MQPVTAIVETPKGSNYKYNYDEQLIGFKLKKALPSGMVFPFDFGFIPGTTGEDGDPLDIIIISEIKNFPGCIIDCRIIGVLNAVQKEPHKKAVRNDRFLGIPEASFLFANITSFKDLPGDIIQQLEQFFINYNKSEGKTFKIIERHEGAQAMKLIKSANS
jgi:inorganic pyrophosphatase